MKYWSEKIHSFYDTEEACKQAEESYEKKMIAQKEEEKNRAETRKADALKVQQAYELSQKTQQDYFKLRNDFVKKYGYYHVSYTDTNAMPLTSLWDYLVRW